jgi:hypothetical protein
LLRAVRLDPCATGPGPQPVRPGWPALDKRRRRDDHVVEEAEAEVAFRGTQPGGNREILTARIERPARVVVACRPADLTHEKINSIPVLAHAHARRRR